jgi:dTDP-L-rhamnose 4-epimerase
MKILITGGAGFIGTHLARKLLAENNEITIFDNFNPQVHGNSKQLPPDIHNLVRTVIGDVCDAREFARVIDGQEVVIHLAAETGTGQSMYKVAHYTDVNIKGTANLFDYLISNKEHHLQKVILASSRAVYGEGKYHCQNHAVIYPDLRTEDHLKAGKFEPVCTICGQECIPLPTDEESRINPVSFYGISKSVQEQITSLFARSLGLTAFILRLQNVYGPGQSLKNPYTGILSIFTSLARDGKTINIFEDGNESRDFVYISDVIEAVWRCINSDFKGINILNIGSGKGTSVLEVARTILNNFGFPSNYVVSGEFRLGDIRHNVADITRAKAVLGFKPEWRLEDGIIEFLRWAGEQSPASLSYDQSLDEMRMKGLLSRG